MNVSKLLINMKFHTYKHTVGKIFVTIKMSKLKKKKLQPPPIPRALCGSNSATIKPGNIINPTELAATYNRRKIPIT